MNKQSGKGELFLKKKEKMKLIRIWPKVKKKIWGGGGSG